MGDIEELYNSYKRWQRSKSKRLLDDPLLVDIEEHLRELFDVVAEKFRFGCRYEEDEFDGTGSGLSEFDEVSA